MHGRVCVRPVRMTRAQIYRQTRHKDDSDVHVREIDIASCRTIAASISRNHIVAIRAPVVACAAKLAITAIFVRTPKREKFAFRIRNTLRLAIVQSSSFTVPKIALMLFSCA